MSNGDQMREIRKSLEHGDKPVEMEEKVVKLNELAEKIGNAPKEVILPNGQTRMSISWDGPTAQAAVKETIPFASLNQKIVFDGPAPAWFVSALTHSVHPMPVGLNDPKIGVVDIPSLPKGAPNPECGIEFAITEGETCVRVDWQLTDPVFDVNNLSKIVVPDIPNGKEVVIGGGMDVLPNSGKGPNYVATAIGEAYAHTNKAVSYYQPQTQGYTTGITHSKDRSIGDVIPKSEIDLDINKFKEQMLTTSQDKGRPKTIENTSHSFVQKPMRTAIAYVEHKKEAAEKAKASKDAKANMDAKGDDSVESGITRQSEAKTETKENDITMESSVHENKEFMP